MVRVLVTAFEPYGVWDQNSSWLTLMELTRDLPAVPQVTTRLYPVDFDVMRERLAVDLSANYEYAVHLGQMPGTGQIVLESVGINVAGSPHRRAEEYEPLTDDGPVAYRSSLPLSAWAARLREAGIPAAVSFHAGLYLCNATLYWSHYLSDKHGYQTKAAFVHLPLCPHQVVKQHGDLASLPTAVQARALRLLLAELVGGTENRRPLTSDL
jgi:pyroglutamyl-peptidase